MNLATIYPQSLRTKVDSGEGPQIDRECLSLLRSEAVALRGVSGTQSVGDVDQLRYFSFSIETFSRRASTLS